MLAFASPYSFLIEGNDHYNTCHKLFKCAVDWWNVNQREASTLSVFLGQVDVRRKERRADFMYWETIYTLHCVRLFIPAELPGKQLVYSSRRQILDE